jgi:4'-phosphopantetheinyl transferase
MDSVHLYRFVQYEALLGSFVADHLHLLPPPRREQCLRYRQPIDQTNCVLAYLLLDQGLREQYGIADPGDFAYGDNGKPYLKDHPHIFFNISHCRHGVVCAVADFEVGVDIQDIRPYDPAVARRVCNAEELLLLAQIDDPASFLCRLWTAKESYAKMLGYGVADVLKLNIPMDCLFCLEAGHYCLAVHCAANAFNVQIHDTWQIT